MATGSLDDQKKKPNRTFGQKWRLVSINNKMVVYFTGVLAVATVLYTLFAGWQLYEIRKGSKDTHDLAVAAGKQADAAKVQSEQAKAQTEKMTEQVEALRKTADAAKMNAGVAQDALQPALGIKIAMATAAETNLKYEVQIHNEGGSPARVVVRYCAFYRVIVSPAPTLKDCTSSVKKGDPITVLPHNFFPIAISATSIPDVLVEKTHFFMPIMLDYSILGKRREDSYCFVYRKIFNSMGACSDLLEP